MNTSSPRSRSASDRWRPDEAGPARDEYTHESLRPCVTLTVSDDLRADERPVSHRPRALRRDRPMRCRSAAGTPPARSDLLAESLIIQDSAERRRDVTAGCRARHDAGVDEGRQVVGQSDDERRDAQHGGVERHGRIHGDDRPARAKQRGKRRRGGEHADVRSAAGDGAIDIGRLGRVGLDRQLHVGHGGNRVDERTAARDAPRRYFVDNEQQRARATAPAASRARGNLARRQGAGSVNQRVEPRAAGHDQRGGGEPAALLEVDTRRSRRTRSVRTGRGNPASSGSPGSAPISSGSCR